MCTGLTTPHRPLDLYNSPEVPLLPSMKDMTMSRPWLIELPWYSPVSPLSHSQSNGSPTPWTPYVLQLSRGEGFSESSTFPPTTTIGLLYGGPEVRWPWRAKLSPAYKVRRSSAIYNQQIMHDWQSAIENRQSPIHKVRRSICDLQSTIRNTQSCFQPAPNPTCSFRGPRRSTRSGAKNR